jgi:hypothetical protein
MHTNNDEVICPNCVTQFRAIPVNVQQELSELTQKQGQQFREFIRVGNKLAALEAENSELRKDAERYRFLRDNPAFQIEYTGELTLDQHVDEAMLEAKP